MTANELPPIPRLSPKLAWEPWRPTRSDPWNRKWAAHLFRRAAFGVPAFQPKKSVSQLFDEAVAQGLDTTLNQVLQGLPDWESFDAITNSLAIRNGSSLVLDLQAPTEETPLVAWWLYRMLYSLHPLREKMTLFWHHHFATSNERVKSLGMMQKQNIRLQQRSLGRFSDLLLSMGRDPALLIFLDSCLNIESNPNEKYAREMMELFSLVAGNYSERDVREAARAFTGWHVNGTEFFFNVSRHDGGRKTILGQTGNWNGDDVARIVLEQPECARYLVRKLCRWFITESTNLPDGLIEPLAEQLRRTQYDVAAVLDTILRSRLFFSHHAYRQRVKSPVEFAVELMRQIGIPCYLVRCGVALRDMGQSLFSPPSVKGWTGGRDWINASTLLARGHFAGWVLGTEMAMDLAELASVYPDFPGALSVRVLDIAGSKVDDQIRWLADQVLHLELDARLHKSLVELLSVPTGKGKPKEKARKPTTLEVAPGKNRSSDITDGKADTANPDTKLLSVESLLAKVPGHLRANNGVGKAGRIDERAQIARLLHSLWLLPEYQIN